MPRKARKKSSTGIYHIMLRGINKQTIFEDNEDYQKFLSTLYDCKEISEFKLYGYCLMSNHVHLLIKVGKEELGQIFKRIGARYVYWYNWKYNRSGHLFQDRFKSEVVEDDKYFITVLRYIHQNPLKVHIVKSIDDYKWSSYFNYIKTKNNINTSLAYNLIKEENFIEFMNQDNNDKCLELNNPPLKMTDDELKVLIIDKCKIKPMMIQNESREIINEILKYILSIDGVSTRQLSRVTGISVNIIWRI